MRLIPFKNANKTQKSFYLGAFMKILYTAAWNRFVVWWAGQRGEAGGPGLAPLH